jgi:hypothetical protein
MVDTLTLSGVNAAQPIVSQSEFARLIHVTRQAVSKMVRDGRLSAGAVTESSQIVVTEALRQLGRAPPSTTTAPPPDAPLGLQPTEDGEYAASRARREAANAQLAELDLAKARGELVDRVGAEQAYRSQVRRLRDRILAVPIEIAAICATLSDEPAIETAIRQALEAALQDTAHAAAGQPDADPDEDHDED